MRGSFIIKILTVWGMIIFLQLFAAPVFGQVKSYTIKDGKMFIRLDKNISDASLDSFITQFNLSDLGLWDFLRKNKVDSVVKQGWQVVTESETIYVISKRIESISDQTNITAKNIFNHQDLSFSALFPAVSNRVIMGYNRFKNKDAFRHNDSIVTFYLRGHKNAKRAYLAGSFNDWSPAAQAMKLTDSGWIAHVKLKPGKYWYKFVVDGNWMVDEDNQLRENDGRGNINSVFFRTNTLFSLKGYTNAGNVFLAGSFNEWKPKNLRMNRTADGWELPLYLVDGTHMYKFVVDGKWIRDEKNPSKAPDGVHDFNSVITIGKPHVFSLKGYKEANRVMLAGSFNDWRDFELPMKKTADGWELSYVIGAGNYEYKFIVDGKWISDPGNPLTPNRDGNSYLIIEPNYTFILKGFENAKQVYVAGDFNSWNPTAFPMKKTKEGWTFRVHLPMGKTRYKFIVDGNWILDPDNKLWEQNEHRTGNSVIWIDQ